MEDHKLYLNIYPDYYTKFLNIIIIRVWALSWMNEKAELIKSFTQCDCGGKIMYKIKIILNKILDYNINFYPGYQ